MRPHFAIPARPPAGVEPQEPPRPPRRRVGPSGLRTLMLGAVVVGVWIGAMAVPGVGRLAAVAFVQVALVVLGFVALMALGWMGFGLLAVAERLALRLRLACRWPDPESWEC